MSTKESVESVVRRVGRLLEDRYRNPSVDDLRQDDDFEEAVDRLCANDVNAERVAKFCRESSTPVACAAIEAVRRRNDAPRQWRTWAIRQTTRVNHVKTCFLLHALAWGPVGEPVVARVLGASEEDWEYESLQREVAWFVQQRIELGEELTAADFGKAVKPEREPFVSSLLRHFDGEPPEAFASVVAEWRRSQIDLDFFRDFAELLEPKIGAELIGGRERALDAILDAVSASPRRSVLLVAEHGVGKTTVAREAAALLSADGWVTIRATAADVNAGQTYIGELEGRIAEIAKRTDGRAVLWLFPNIEEGLWAGQHSRSPRGMLDALLPHLQAGRVVVVGEIDPMAYELLVQSRPRAASAFTVVRLAPFSEADALRLARGALARADLKATDQTLRESYELAEHYLPGVASPGGLLRVLDQAAARLQPGVDEVTTRVVLDGIAEASGLPLHILDARVPLQLDAVRATFERRVLGQPEAVECLIERIAMIKAGLTDPTRPLGVFLFVGPTGTGKTEIAKTLAEFVFGSSSRLVRLDMSEFQTSESHERLLGDSAVEEYGAASLISSVRREPFSVVLLDEFEKAHSNIWDLFLQVFDDGRLTDSRGRAVDFRHCVFVLTSNVGSAIPGGLGVGFDQVKGHFAPAAVERAVARSFRPELLNRLDRVVVFRPLERETMRSLLRSELASVLERRGFRTLPWAVEWDESAVDFLLERGFSAELGARPLKRAVERYVLAPLAMAIAERQFPEGDQFLFLTAGDDRIDVTFVDPDADDRPQQPASPAPVELALERLVSEPQGTAHEVEFLCEQRDRIGPLVEGWSGRKDDALGAMADPDFWERDDRAKVLGFVEYVDRLEAAWRTGVRLTARLERGNGNRPATKAVGIVAQRLYVLDRALEGLRRGQPADAFVRVVATADDADTIEFAGELVAMYESWAAARGMRSERAPGSEGDTLAISGLGAYPILAQESGVHVLEEPEGERGIRRRKVRVTVVAQLPAADGEHTEPDEAFRRLRGRQPGIVRRYRREPSPLVRDAVRGWRTGRIDRVLAGDFDVIE